MRAAVQWQALAAIFNGRCDHVTTGAVLSSKIAVTAGILGLYEQNLGANPTFQAWFASASQGRISLHLPSLAPRKVKAVDLVSNGYSTAAYFGSSSLFAHPPDISDAAVQALESVGTRLIPVTKRIDFPIEGDNPVFTIATESMGTADFGCLDRFLAPEDSVVIYDKFINSKSIQLLEHIARILAPASTLRVFHTFRTGANLLDTATIFTRLTAANSAITVDCKKVSDAFKKLEHDRYIFLGERLQIVFSAGLDCFGEANATNGKRNNRRSKITFYDVTGGENLQIEGDDGSIFLVKSIGQL